MYVCVCFNISIKHSRQSNWQKIHGHRSFVPEQFSDSNVSNFLYVRITRPTTDLIETMMKPKQTWRGFKEVTFFDWRLRFRVGRSTNIIESNPIWLKYWQLLLVNLLQSFHFQRIIISQVQNVKFYLSLQSTWLVWQYAESWAQNDWEQQMKEQSPNKSR